ncbi:MAG: response regulator [Lawsonibacter sp.]
MEDDDSIRELVVYTHAQPRASRRRALSGPAQFWAALDEARTPALVLLDIMLPEEDGLHILKRLRGRRGHRPTCRSLC